LNLNIVFYIVVFFLAVCWSFRPAKQGGNTQIFSVGDNTNREQNKLNIFKEMDSRFHGNDNHCDNIFEYLLKIIFFKL
jgi:hypothetical protein